MGLRLHRLWFVKAFLSPASKFQASTSDLAKTTYHLVILSQSDLPPPSIGKTQNMICGDTHKGTEIFIMHMAHRMTGKLSFPQFLHKTSLSHSFTNSLG
jgi:hypothetical protein